jgi:KaiC/GvpD/RAD55 family RecA-like ATPase
MERVPTGITELDVKLSGGYPKGKGLLVTGVSGAGKTIFGLHLLYRSCVDGKECVLIATEETPEDIFVQAEMIGLDLAKYYDNGQLIIGRVFESRSNKSRQVTKYGFAQEGLEVELSQLADYVPDSTSIAVIDNIGVFTLRSTAQDFRDQFDALNFTLNKKGCTTMFIMDESAYLMTNQVADYSAYGSVRLLVKENPYTDKVERYFTIPKMRSTNVMPDLTVFEITPEGIRLKTKTD